MPATAVSRVIVAPRATLSGSRARARRSVAGAPISRRAHSNAGRRVVVRATAAEELPPTDWAREWRGAFSGDENGTLSEFMRAACERLSGVETRFIVIADAAILESVQPWPSEPRFAELGAKGTCCTLASPDKSFEAHIFLAKVRHVALARSERGGRKIYAVRFFGRGAGARSGRGAAASTAHRRASRSRRRGSARRRGGEVGGARPNASQSESIGNERTGGVISSRGERLCHRQGGARQLAK